MDAFRVSRRLRKVALELIEVISLKHHGECEVSFSLLSRRDVAQKTLTELELELETI